MNWLRRNRLLLAAVFVASALVSFAELRWVLARNGFRAERWQLGLIMLPWFVTAASLLGLSYLLWFDRNVSERWMLLGKLVFWSIAASFCAMFISIYGSAVFGIF